MDLKQMKELEQAFYDYTRQYDRNIKRLIKDRCLEISVVEMEEILQDAKYMVE